MLKRSLEGLEERMMSVEGEVEGVRGQLSAALEQK